MDQQQKEELERLLALHNKEMKTASSQNGAVGGESKKPSSQLPLTKENMLGNFCSKHPFLIILLVVFGILSIIGSVQNSKRLAREQEQARLAAERQAEEEENWRSITELKVGDGYNGGNKYISYDLDAGEYTKQFIPSGKCAKNADEVYAVIYYSSSYHEEELMDLADFQSAGMWQLQTLHVKVVTRSDGQVLAEKDFEAKVGGVTLEENARKTIDVKPRDVEKWVDGHFVDE